MSEEKEIAKGLLACGSILIDGVLNESANLDEEMSNKIIKAAKEWAKGCSNSPDCHECDEAFCDYIKSLFGRYK